MAIIHENTENSIAGRIQKIEKSISLRNRKENRKYVILICIFLLILFFMYSHSGGVQGFGFDVCRRMQTSGNFLLLLSSIPVMVLLWASGYFLLPSFIFVCIRFMVLSTATLEEEEALAILRSGLEGETYALKMLSKLSDEYHLFTNTIIPYDGKQSETDVIVVGPTGVFIVEVKNYKGTISGRCDDQSLVHIKTKGESEYVYNPLKQVSTHVYRLANFLRDKGIQCWVNGGVFFTNDALTLEINGDTEQCRKYMHSCLELTSWIKENGSPLSEDMVNRIVSCIALL